MEMRLKLRHISTVSGVKNIRPAHNGKAGRAKLSHNNIILSAGAVADQQLPSLVPAYDDPDVAVVRVKGQVSRLGLGRGDIGAVAALHANAPAVAYDIALAVVEYPIHKAGTVKAEGPVSAGFSAFMPIAW